MLSFWSGVNVRLAGAAAGSYVVGHVPILGACRQGCGVGQGHGIGDSCLAREG